MSSFSAKAPGSRARRMIATPFYLVAVVCFARFIYCGFTGHPMQALFCFIAGMTGAAIELLLIYG